MWRCRIRWALVVTIRASFLSGTKSNGMDSANSRNRTNPREQKVSWLERVENLIDVLEGSTVGELELSEAGTEIIIRRRPDMMMVNIAAQQMAAGQVGVS